MAFLEILTRCYQRPNLLAANQSALAEQTDTDWMQVYLHDEVGRGVGASYVRLAAHAPQLVGDYIWILDDDDVCIRPSLVAELKTIAQVEDPDVIMVKMDHGPRGVLPPIGLWGKRPECGAVGISAVIVRRSVWQAHAGAFLPGHYAADFDFIAAIFASGASVYWHNVIASRVQVIGLGRPERELGDCRLETV